MGKRISKESLVATGWVVIQNPLIDVDSKEYNNVRRLRRHKIKVHRIRNGKYFLELNWREKIEELFNG